VLIRAWFWKMSSTSDRIVDRIQLSLNYYSVRSSLDPVSV
jgi:hypothetical protein